MKKFPIIILMFLLSNLSYATFDQCMGVYVGRISVNDQSGLSKVVFLERPDSASGSYWVYFTGWDAQATQSALSLLMAAKLSQHRVDVYTTAENKCNIGTGGQVLSEIDLSTNP